MWKKRLVLIGSVLLLVTATIAFKTINGKEQAVAAGDEVTILIEDDGTESIVKVWITA